MKKAIGVVLVAAAGMIFLLAVVFSRNCGSPPPVEILPAPAENPHRIRIAMALHSLLGRTNRDAFVIFQDKPSGKFVQFAGSADESLFLDLPPQALNEDEKPRAAKLFRELAAKGPKEGADRQTGKGLTGFQLRLGCDVDRGADVTLRIFREVYQLPADFALVLEEN